MLATLAIALALGAGAPEARELAKRSMIEYDAGDFDKALADAQKAYELDPVPALLYNLGQVHRALHHWERAEFFYRGYLRRKPTAPNRSSVRALIAEMEAQQKGETSPAAPILVEAPSRTTSATPAPNTAAQTATTTAVQAEAGVTHSSLPAAPVAADTAPPPARGIPMGAGVGGGVGLAALGVGIAMAVIAGGIAGQDTAQTKSTAYHTIDQASFNNEVTDAYVANGGIYGGAAAVVAGVLWGVFGRGSAAPAPANP